MASRISDFPVTFGTSGARGLVADLTDAYCGTFTATFLGILGAGVGELLIGHDLRPSSPGIAAACIGAARSMGVVCRYAGAVPTPALALAGMSRGLPAIMVTGSHIPADRNGLKAYRSHGEITKADEQAMLAAVIDLPKDSPVPELPAEDGRVIRDYATRYLSGFGRAALKGLRIGVYEQSSVGRDLLHQVLGALGATTTGLGRRDVFVPVDTEAVRPEDRVLAKDWAAGGAFDAIVSADGDADRPLVADETGEWLRGDTLGLLTARALGIRSVVTPVNSNTALEACGAFDTVHRTRIGSPYVIAGMEQAGLTAPVAGFEANGGFLLGSDVRIGSRQLAALPTRDALLPIIVTLAETRRLKISLSRLVDDLPARFTHSSRLPDFTARQSVELLARLAQDSALAGVLMAPCSGEATAVDRTDGFRVTFADGSIVHLRPSGNAPELRCYAEASTAEAAENLCSGCLERLATGSHS